MYVLQFVVTFLLLWKRTAMTGLCESGVLGYLRFHSNTNNGDGCSADCQTESGWTCFGSDCYPTCGNLILTDYGTGTLPYLDLLNIETCEDGNAVSNDGCSSTCRVELGWNCSKTIPTSCNTVCQDGIKTFDEGCDVGQVNGTDGCYANCTVVSGYKCTIFNSTSASVCTIFCGDGIILGDEVRLASFSF